MGFDGVFSKGHWADRFAKSNVVVGTSHIALLLENFSYFCDLILAAEKFIFHHSEYGRIVKFLRKFGDRIGRV
ncbi:hypothetical protein [Sinorhizobium fredii]|uniref:hypothetical protein n=1 Tax=Rhizobium fredii TaxID=380 RepID=UPI0035170748